HHPSSVLFSLLPRPRRSTLFPYTTLFRSASLPAYRDGILFYENEPDYFRTSAKQLRDQGVRLIGGCCGTTPEHVRALAEGVKGLAPITEKVVKEREKIEVLKEVERTEKTIPELAKESTTIIVE